MVFSSVVFLFLFLPFFFALYLATPWPARNAGLLLASAVFYFWGEAWLLGVMLGSALLDFACAAWMTRGVAGHRLQPGTPRSPARRLALAVSLAGNLGVLGFFKYFDFGIDNWRRLVTAAGLDGLAWDPALAVTLPLGISFYTFQSMSYTIDVFRGEVAATRRPLDFLCFVTMFPQLVAGPIVRYRDVAAQLVARRIDGAGFAAGVRRFTVGLGKKVLIANSVAVPADAIFGLPPDRLTAPVAWFGLLAYTLQIYFDFSGYSDMAIGLGRMLGFRLPENFAHPYAARSVREFWRRWHITLSTWFRDYLFVPLGGSRRGPWRTYRNLLVVFLLCGLWHGAAWTFVAWGLWHGIFLIVERRLAQRQLGPAWAAHAYTVLVVALGWVLFRAPSLGHALAYLRALAGAAAGATHLHPLVHFVDAKLIAVMLLGTAGCLPLVPRLVDSGTRSAPRLLALARSAAVVAVLLACAMTLSAGTHNPFIYFRF